jgi:uncharacterized protein with NAD-binding domain and iron-sulfur cluster
MNDDRPKEVAVFGAGIAGLTAAHELIERGFRVEVYETQPPSPVEQVTGMPCAIGGMAETQWARVERTAGPAEPCFCALRPAAVRLSQVVSFAPGSAELPPDTGPMDEVVKILCDRPEIKHVEVRGFTEEPLDPYPTPEELERAPRLDWRRARAVADYVVEALRRRGVMDRTIEPAAYGLGHRDDWTRPAVDRNHVSFRVVEDLIPGEHGFRFFPWFYRNLFDTMARIPVPDDREVYVETGRTTLDNLIPTEAQGINPNRPRPSLVLPRREIASLQELFDVTQQILRSLGFTAADVGRLLLKLFTYMTSCRERREAEYEHRSWWDLVDGDRFSPAFQHYLDATPQTLVGMTARESDARTYGTIAVQMLLDHLADTPRTDSTLNGPTSLAWLAHWRRYLQSQGVEFHRGTLEGFEVFNDRTLWPKVRLYRERDEVPTTLVRDYYVVALPVEEIQRLILEHDRRGKPLAGEDFDRIRALALGDPTKADPGGAFAHLSGIQYYFDSDVAFVRGHTAYVDAEWGLSSISQPQFWANRRGWWSGYRGVLSVDITNWHTPSTVTGRTAWESTRDEIAAEVWRQIKETIDDPTTVPEPILYHLDDHIELGPDGRPARNHCPFLITRVGEYRRRPGRFHADGYAVHYGSLVLAGTYMQTHTRMTTMEAANESARHAVNGLLKEARFQGARCAIANPEDHEPADLRFLVELDRRLHALGLPHLLEILDLREVPRALLRPDPDLGAIGLKHLPDGGAGDERR